MSSARDEFLQRVRQAVAQGNRAGHAPGLEPRGTVGYQGAGKDPAARFCEELRAAGGFPHLAESPRAAFDRVKDLLREESARKVLLGRGPVLDGLNLGELLPADGYEVVSIETLNPDTCRDPFFQADVGISGVDFLVAETGSVVVGAGPLKPRSVSLLPPVHIAVAHGEQLLPDLFDLFDRLSPGPAPALPPSALTLITGPSKTGDIELRLVTGVHGPGRVHVILLGP